MVSSAGYGGAASHKQTLHSKERQRDQGTDTAKDYAQNAKGVERLGGGVSSVLQFWVRGIEDHRRDRRCCTGCDGIREEMPPGLAVSEVVGYSSPGVIYGRHTDGFVS
jgi:hypothetical protein